MAEINLDAPSLAQNIVITVHIKRMRWFRIKTWTAVQLMHLGALIGGFGFKVNED